MLGIVRPNPLLIVRVILYSVFVVFSLVGVIFTAEEKISACPCALLHCSLFSPLSIAASRERVRIVALLVYM